MLQVEVVNCTEERLFDALEEFRYTIKAER